MGMMGKWEMKDCFEAVELNQYGYYQLRDMNSTEERQKMFAETYFQEYDGATYSKQYSEEELAYLNRKFREKEYVIQQNLKKTGVFPGGGIYAA